MDFFGTIGSIIDHIKVPLNTNLISERISKFFLEPIFKWSHRQRLIKCDPNNKWRRICDVIDFSFYIKNDFFNDFSNYSFLMVRSKDFSIIKKVIIKFTGKSRNIICEGDDFIFYDLKNIPIRKNINHLKDEYIEVDENNKMYMSHEIYEISFEIELNSGEKQFEKLILHPSMSYYFEPSIKAWNKYWNLECIEFLKIHLRNQIRFHSSPRYYGSNYSLPRYYSSLQNKFKILEFIVGKETLFKIYFWAILIHKRFTSNLNDDFSAYLPSKNPKLA